MTFGLKAALREALPKSAQVPIKFWLDRVRGFLEPEMALLPVLVSPGCRVVDVGGNRGVYAYRFWKLGAQVDVFEPNPVCLAVLGAWSRGKPRITLHPCGLSDGNGSAELHIPIDDAGVEHDASASLERHEFGQERAQAVSIATLDSFGLKEVSFIKIDVEGHESRVIEGARKTLASCRPALLVEIEQRHCAGPIGDVFDRILAQGYEGYFLDEGRLRPFASFDVDQHQPAGQLGQKDGSYINNFLFLHGSRRAAGEYPGLAAFGLSQ
ncbi:FkbM family methyltransferase [Arenimonas sp.]|uniref:FkbM family methyltransferase n=1 Tax=Arenimonas sp. TaxID=1872635 RepID=UPI0025BA0881|nr:FkbM family methyltransferase [Arenimonas sp.]